VKRRAVRVAILALVAVSSWGVAPARADGEPDLEKLRSAIRDSRERVSAYEREQRGLLEAVEALDRAIAELASEVRHVQRVADRARETLEKVESETEEIRKRREVLQRAMSARAVALYKAGSAGPVRLLFAAEGVRGFLSRLRTLKLLLGHDADLLERHRIESAALLDAEARARDALAHRDEALAQLRTRSNQLAGERQVKQTVVARLHGDRSRERAALIELEAAAQALEEALATLQQAPPPPRSLGGPPFESLRQQLMPPVDAQIAKSFGRVVDAEFRTETFRSGVEFDAPLGAEVQAVAGGHVRFAGWFRGYGKLVILDHGDSYFSVLGHLAEIRVNLGDEVRSRDVIGTVGDTGSLSGPNLYFEIRHGGEPQDPRHWLRLSKKG
jgi:septal ring factor EnvC (AmiA/AmiB activator)